MLALIMLGNTFITCALPDSINDRKPTLREFAHAEHERLEKSSIELVELKVMERQEEEEKVPVAAANDNSAVPCPSERLVIPPSEAQKPE